MSEVNAVETIRKNQVVDAADDVAEEKTTAASEETTTGSDKSIMEFGETSSDSSYYPGLSISSKNTTTVVQGHVSVPQQASSQEDDKSEKLSRKESAFIRKCFKKMPDMTKEEEAEMKKIVKDLMVSLKRSESAENKRLLVAEAIAANKIDISDDALDSIVDSYVRMFESDDKKHKFILSSAEKKERAEYSRQATEAIKFKTNTIKANNDANILRDFALEQVRYCMEPTKNSSDEELQEMVADFKYKVIHAETEEERREIIANALEDMNDMYDLPELERRIEAYAKENNIDIEAVRKFSKDYNSSRSLSRDVLLYMFPDNPDIRKLIIDEAANDIHKSRNELNKALIKCGNPKSAEQVEEWVQATEEFEHLQVANIKELVANGDYDDEFVEHINKVCEKVLQETRKYTEQFLQEYFESEAGQILKKQTQYAIHEIKEAKVELAECKENTQKATEDALVAKSESEKAIKEAKEEKQKSEAIAERCGFKDLDFQSLYKVVKQESPSQAINLLYAKDKEKKAYWAEYDANVAKHHAEFLEGLAKKHFEFAQMKVAAAFAKMQAIASVLK
ncbi:MAG: hypothetical protein K6A44_06910 [bacterium]|nr:hypothetical protein [bacterium]